MAIYKTGNRKYYKYVWEDFTQPTLSANGTLGGDSFAVYTPNTVDQYGPIYNAFNESAANEPHIYDELPCSIVFYNPKPLKVEKISLIQHTTAYWVKGVFQGCNDNSSWTDIKPIDFSGTPITFEANSETAYKYHRFYITSAYSNDTLIGKIQITAKELIVVESTSSDHDYSVVEPDKIKDVYKSTERKYYKYGTELDATVVGSPTIEDGVVSGFTTANYLQTTDSFSPENNPWEVVIKKNFSDVTTYQYFLSVGGSSDFVFQLFIEDSKLCMDIGNGSSWQTTNVAGTTTLSTSVDYWIKLEYTGTTYNSYISTNGVDYNLEASYTSSTVVGGGIINIGISRTKAYPALGLIDLTQSYIKINGKEWWHGTKAVETTPDDAVYSDVLKKRIVAAYKTGKRKYYKYPFEDNELPVLTENGTMGGDKFAVSASSNADNAYKAFAGNDKWVSKTYDTAPQWLTFYNPNAIMLKKITLNYGNDESYYYAKGIYIQGSNDNTDWETLYTYTASAKVSEIICEVNSKTAYKYHRIYVYDRAYYNSEYCVVILGVAEIDGCIESTSSDYDYSAVETPQLVYNLKYDLNSSSAYAKEGVVSGSDMFGADRGMAGTQSLNQTSVFTFNTPAPSGKYTGSFVYYSQVNFTMSQVYWRLTYEDGTQEYAYGPTSLGDTAYGGSETATVSLSFTAKKPIKAVTVYANGAGGGSGRYGGLGSIQMFFDGSKQ